MERRKDTQKHKPIEREERRHKRDRERERETERERDGEGESKRRQQEEKQKETENKETKGDGKRRHSLIHQRHYNFACCSVCLLLLKLKALRPPHRETARQASIYCSAAKP